MFRFFAFFTFVCFHLTGQERAETLAFRAPLSGSAGNAAATILVHVVRDAGGQAISGSVDLQLTAPLPAGSFLRIQRGDSVVFDYGEVRTATGVLPQFQVRGDSEESQTALRTLLQDPASHLVFAQLPESDMRGNFERAEMAVALGEFVQDAGLARHSGALAVTGLRSSSGGSITFTATLQTQGGQFNGSGFSLNSGAASGNGAALVTANGALISVLGLAATVSATAEVTAATRSALDGLFDNPAGFHGAIRAADGGAIRVDLKPTLRRQFRVSTTPTGAVPTLTDPENVTRDLVTVYTADGVGQAAHVVFDVNVRLKQRAELCMAAVRQAAGSATVAASSTRVCDAAVFGEGFGNLYRTANVVGPGVFDRMAGLGGDPGGHYLTLEGVGNASRIVEALRGTLAAN